MLITRYAKMVMSLVLASFCLLVTFDNITDYGTNYLFVQHVLSMDTTFPGNALMYRSITNPAVWRAAYAAIIAAEGITGLLFLLGAFRLFQLRSAEAAEFNSASPPACSPSSSGSSASWWLPASGSPCGSQRPGTDKRLPSASMLPSWACRSSSTSRTPISSHAGICTRIVARGRAVYYRAHVRAAARRKASGGCGLRTARLAFALGG
jgi:Predicted small integral membrane protein (DUF2165)